MKLPKAERPENLNHPSSIDDAFGLGRLMCLLGIMIFICYPDVILGSHTFVYRDAGLLSFPLAYYSKFCLQHGQLPLWNPYNNCGIPFLAQWHTMVLYPFSLLYIWLPMPWSLNYFLIAHIFLAGAGMYLLARRWFGNRLAATLAGLVFAWNGSSIDSLMWPANTSALGWLPWVVLLTERAVAEGGPAMIWAVLAGACQMLTGAPEIILSTWLIVVPVCALPWARTKPDFWRIARRIGIVVGGVTALSAAQLLPWLEFVTHGDRGSSYGGDVWSIPLWGVANFLVPLFRHTASIAGVFWQPGQEVFSSYYLGGLTIVLGIVAIVVRRDRHTQVVAGLALVGFLLACGDAGVILPVLKKIIPILGFSRYPAKFLVIATFCLPLLAASAMAWLQSGVNRRLVLLAGALAATFILCILATAHAHPFPDEVWSVTWKSAWTRLAFLFTGIGILYWQTSPTTLSNRRALGFVFLLLAGADICSHAPRQNPTAPVQAYDAMTPPMNQVPRLGQSRALVSPRAELWLNHLGNPTPLALYVGQRMDLFKDCNLIDRIPKVDGFFPMYLQRESEVERLFSDHERLPHLAEFLGVSQIASARTLFSWDPQSSFMPCATIGQRPVFMDDKASLEAVGSDQFNPRAEVFLPVEARGKIAAQSAPDARVLYSWMGLSQCQFKTSSSRPAILVLAQSWYPCWKAEIDGHSALVWRANYAFQALDVPAGRHLVRMIYRDWFFIIGAAISVMSLAGCGYAAWRLKI